MTFRHLPDDIDPRRSLKARREDRDELEEFEDVTDEVAREGNGAGEGESAESRKRARRKELQEREEFEELTGEVTREDDDEIA